MGADGILSYSFFKRMKNKRSEPRKEEKES
jgi:hypothetical protein